MFDVASCRRQFSMLSEQSDVGASPSDLIYLDNAASTYKPDRVVEAVDRYHQEYCSNVHRGQYASALQATEQYEASRDTVQSFINAYSREEIVFTSGTTGSINLLAQTLASTWSGDDEVLIAESEHHSNIVPWQLAAKRYGFNISVIPMFSSGARAGHLNIDEFKARINANTRLVCVAAISNALGVVNPIDDIIDIAHKNNSQVLVDGAQAVAHQVVDVQALNCDYYVFSGHKLFAPTGIGVLYAKHEHLHMLPPWQGGGEMIKTVSFDNTTYADLPWRFEAGTPPIAQAIGLGAAVQWFQQYDLTAVEQHVHTLLMYAREQLLNIEGVRLLGDGVEQCAIQSLVVEGVHHSDLAMLLAEQNIAVRSGHHCAMPLMQALHIDGTLRLSFALYNTQQEIDVFIDALKQALALLK